MIHLNNEQQKAVRHVDGPMLVLAGPGSGKTAVLTERVKYLIESAHVVAGSILVLTFSNKAANEMRRRFNASVDASRDYPVNFGTIHSIFFQVLKQYKNYTNDSIISPSQRMAVIRDIGYKLSVRDNIDDRWCIDTLNQISAYKNTGKMPYYLSDRESDLFPDIVFEYKERLKKNKLLDFDDMITDCLVLLKENENILNRLKEKYKYILVDEFQDCNKDQYELIKMISGSEANFFAVGDDDQSIYGFRGADAGIVLRFLDDYKNCGYVELIRNYRCGGNIIDAAHNLISHNICRKVKTKQLPSILRESGEVYVIKTEDAYKEAWIVGNIINNLLKEGVSLKDVSILYRTETASDYLQEYLSKIKINCNKTKSENIINQDSFKDVIAYFKISQGIMDPQNFLRILNKPDRGLLRECVRGVSQAEMMSYYSEDAEKQRAIDTLFKDVKFISKLTPYAAAMYLNKKVGICISDNVYEYMQNYQSINELLISLNRNNTINNKTGDEVILQTIHASKGLEYDTVIIIGLQEGMMPHNHAEDEEDVEEERRLMYVAMTRAKKRLYLLARGKEAHGKKYSRFIYELSDYNSIESYTPSSKNSSKASSTSSYSASSSM